MEVPYKLVMLWSPWEGGRELFRWSHAAALCSVIEQLQMLGNVQEESDWDFNFVLWNSFLTDPDPEVRIHPRCVSEMWIEGDAVSKKPCGIFSVINDKWIVLNADFQMTKKICLCEDTNVVSFAPTMNVHFSGLQYRVGDFRVKIAEFYAIEFPKLRGSMMEMECLRPNLTPNDALGLILEMVEPLLDSVTKQVSHGEFTMIDPEYDAYGLPKDRYTLHHTAVTYDKMFMTFIRQQIEQWPRLNNKAATSIY